MMNRLFTFFFVLLLSSWNAYGQVPPESPAGVGVVSPIVPGSEAVPSWAMNATFKYGILDALSGKIGFYVQADVTPIACLELGLGITRKIFCLKQRLVQVRIMDIS
ncbi:MAG: hypothetical protein IPJ26_06275 [Bacteroidetes bacterium]|nr:hypothetical protein [Bacteroidota bacterium]